LRTPARNP